MARLYANYIMRGMWKYEDVPAYFEPEVRAILEVEGPEFLPED